MGLLTPTYQRTTERNQGDRTAYKYTGESTHRIDLYTSIMAPPLPLDRETQTYVTIQALSLGRVSLPYNWIFQDSLHAPDEERSDLPFIGALITHPTRGKALYDLGVRKVRFL